MIGCAMHGRLFLPLQQVWITAKHEDVPQVIRSPQTLETACAARVSEAKPSLTKWLPHL
jgi:hypothetical protein